MNIELLLGVLVGWVTGTLIVNVSLMFFHKEIFGLLDGLVHRVRRLFRLKD